FPAVFVGGAVLLGLLLPVIRSRNRETWSAYVTCVLALGGAFAGVLMLSAGSDFQPTRAFMFEYWSARGGFPPWEPAALAKWLFEVHVGDRLFYLPYGAENGGGAPALFCCAIGAASLYCSGQRAVLTMLAAMFGLAFLAAAMG